MATIPTTFPAAPLDLTARIVTVMIWALTAGMIAGGAIALQQGASPAGVILLAVGGSLAALHGWLRRIEPRSYVVDDGSLRVERRSDSKRFVGPFVNVRRGALGWRVAGDGGGYGYLGRFRADGRTVSAYVTDRSKVVLLDVGGAALALSPDDPDEFVERLGRGG
jgi:hypothetical protein